MHGPFYINLAISKSAKPKGESQNSVFSAGTIYFDIVMTEENEVKKMLINNFNSHAFKWPIFRGEITPIVSSRGDINPVYEEYYKFHLQKNTLY